MTSRPILSLAALALASTALACSNADSEPRASKNAPPPNTAKKLGSDRTAKDTAKAGPAPTPSTSSDVIGPKSLPPRVKSLAQSGSPEMQALIEKARAQTGEEAAKTWVEAAKRAQKAREIPSALDLYQLAQRAAPKFCPGFTGARTLLTELGKPTIALMVLASERNCDGADKSALKAEADRLQELLVVDEHGHEGKGAPPGMQPKRKVLGSP